MNKHICTLCGFELKHHMIHKEDSTIVTTHWHICLQCRHLQHIPRSEQTYHILKKSMRVYLRAMFYSKRKRSFQSIMRRCFRHPMCHHCHSEDLLLWDGRCPKCHSLLMHLEG